MTENDQEKKMAINRKDAKNWIRDVLTPALRNLARTRYAGEPTQSIHPLLGTTLEFEDHWPELDADCSYDHSVYPIKETRERIPLSYRIRLVVSAQGVTGFIKFAKQQGMKISSKTVSDILDWDIEKIKRDFDDRFQQKNMM